MEVPDTHVESGHAEAIGPSFESSRWLLTRRPAAADGDLKTLQ